MFRQKKTNLCLTDVFGTGLTPVWITEELMDTEGNFLHDPLIYISAKWPLWTECASEKPSSCVAGGRPES